MKTKTELIRQGKAALHNCEGVDVTIKAAKYIWPQRYEVGAIANYYIDLNGHWWAIDETNLPTFTPSEIIAEHEQPKVKRYETRSGLAVELLTDKGRGITPFVGYVDGRDALMTWYGNGSYSITESQFDLIEVTDQQPTQDPERLAKIIEEIKRIVNS